MTQTLRTPTAAQAPTDVGPTIRVGLPRLPTEVVVRPRLYERLTAGSRGRLTVVQAPTGAGKTFGVAGWATQASVQSMIWLGDVGLSKDAAVFWGRLRADLLRLGVGPLSDPPPTQADDLRWSTWLGDLATALRSRGTSCLVILDDFPAGRCTRLGRQLATVSAQAADALRLVVICPTTPALDLSDALAGGYSHIEATELRLSEDEVAKLLAVRGVTVDPSVVAAVTARTFGWARGVELAAQTFSSSGVGDALDRLDAVVDALIEQEVLAELPAYGRELIVRTSVAADVPRGLAQAVLGAHVALAPELVTCRKGFIEPRQDGSFKCHPLLRRSALRRLDEDWPCLAGEARRAAAGWLIECGVRAAGLRVVAEVGDWNWLASALVTSLAVPAIVMGATEEVIATPVQASAVEKVEPLIAAAAAASRGDVESANVALARMTDAAGSSRADNPAYRLGDAVVRMSLARQIADHPAGLHWVTEGRRQWAHLGTEQHRAREVGWMLDGHEAAFLLWRGDLEAAAAVLGQPIDLSTVAGVEQVAGADCVGLLAWLEALRGNLTVAARHAAAVLTARPADCAETGVGFAQLAAAWVHLERSELQQARQRLLHGRRLDMSRHDPGLATARRLAEARLTTASGEPDMALRMLASVGPTGVEAGSAWLADRWCVATAEAHLAADDPQRALACLTPEPQHALVEARVIAVAARRDIGDRRGALAILAAVEGGVAGTSLPVAVQVWCLGAQLADGTGDIGRVRSLVGRALRAADREGLRLALCLVMPWLATHLDRNPDLARRHRVLVASLPRTQSGTKETAHRADIPDPLLDPLSERERQVLDRLAQLSTTDEIARELFLSANTIKSHIKSLFLKLSVNRRADAVRRGRQLGLC